MGVRCWCQAPAARVCAAGSGRAEAARRCPQGQLSPPRPAPPHPTGPASPLALGTPAGQTCQPSSVPYCEVRAASAGVCRAPGPAGLAQLHCDAAQSPCCSLSPGGHERAAPLAELGGPPGRAEGWAAAGWALGSSDPGSIGGPAQDEAEEPPASRASCLALSPDRPLGHALRTVEQHIQHLAQHLDHVTNPAVWRAEFPSDARSSEDSRPSSLCSCACCSGRDAASRLREPWGTLPLTPPPAGQGPPSRCPGTAAAQGNSAAGSAQPLAKHRAGEALGRWAGRTGQVAPRGLGVAMQSSALPRPGCLAQQGPSEPAPGPAASGSSTSIALSTDGASFLSIAWRERLEWHVQSKPHAAPAPRRPMAGPIGTRRGSEPGHRLQGLGRMQKTGASPPRSQGSHVCVPAAGSSGRAPCPAVLGGLTLAGVAKLQHHVARKSFQCRLETLPWLVRRSQGSAALPQPRRPWEQARKEQHPAAPAMQPSSARSLQSSPSRERPALWGLPMWLAQSLAKLLPPWGPGEEGAAALGKQAWLDKDGHGQQDAPWPLWALPSTLLRLLQALLLPAPGERKPQPCAEAVRQRQEPCVCPLGLPRAGLGRLSPQAAARLQAHGARKCLEIRAGAVPGVVSASQEAVCAGEPPALPKLLRPGQRRPQPRPSRCPALGPEAAWRIELHIRQKGLLLRWGLPVLYTQSLARLVPRAPRRLAPRAEGGPGVELAEQNTPFLSTPTRDRLEWHIRSKRLQHQWGLPPLLQRSLAAFQAPAPRHGAPGPRHPRDVAVGPQALPFLSSSVQRDLESHLLTMKVQRRWGLPRRVQASLQRFMPPVPGHAASSRPPTPGHAASSRPPTPGHATSSHLLTLGHAASSRPPTPGHAASSRPPTPGHATSSHLLTLGHAASSRPPTPGHTASSRPPTPGHATFSRLLTPGHDASSHATSSRPPTPGHATFSRLLTLGHAASSHLPTPGHAASSHLSTTSHAASSRPPTPGHAASSCLLSPDHAASSHPPTPDDSAFSRLPTPSYESANQLLYQMLTSCHALPTQLPTSGHALPSPGHAPASQPVHQPPMLGQAPCSQLPTLGHTLTNWILHQPCHVQPSPGHAPASQPLHQPPMLGQAPCSQLPTLGHTPTTWLHQPCPGHAPASQPSFQLCVQKGNGAHAPLQVPSPGLSGAMPLPPTLLPEAMGLPGSRGRAGQLRAQSGPRHSPHLMHPGVTWGDATRPQPGRTTIASQSRAPGRRQRRPRKHVLRMDSHPMRGAQGSGGPSCPPPAEPSQGTPASPEWLIRSIVNSLGTERAAQDLQLQLLSWGQLSVEYPVCLQCCCCLERACPHHPAPQAQRSPRLVVYPKLSVGQGRGGHGRLRMSLGFLLKIKRKQASKWQLIQEPPSKVGPGRTMEGAPGGPRQPTSQPGLKGAHGVQPPRGQPPCRTSSQAARPGAPRHPTTPHSSLGAMPLLQGAQRRAAAFWLQEGSASDSTMELPGATTVRTSVPPQDPRRLRDPSCVHAPPQAALQAPAPQSQPQPAAPRRGASPTPAPRQPPRDTILKRLVSSVQRVCARLRGKGQGRAKASASLRRSGSFTQRPRSPVVPN
ncbi:proline-rich protein 30 isoform X2 [Pelodiscus sinensis]|uniref:proline-rich protein 30 isoform X2 n=1 Tax=Pelodiscus sinensis TaxID=13735 RepID=UPI003F6BC5A1